MPASTDSGRNDRLLTLAPALLLAIVSGAALRLAPFDGFDAGAEHKIVHGIEYAPVASCRVNINMAQEAELQLLPQIGAALAKRIVEDRERRGPFRSVSDLDRVRGIGERTALRMAPFATVGDGGTIPPNVH